MHIQSEWEREIENECFARVMKKQGEEGAKGRADTHTLYTDSITCKKEYCDRLKLS